ncbi:MAG: MupA/Atu3671 family FMN-dependent luciferase-like monooxygenase [Polyangiales bacterium]
MPSTQRYRAVFVGADSLLMECAERWLEQGHGISAVLSDTPRIRSWAERRGLRVLALRDYHTLGATRTESGEHTSFEYLFSVTHLAILPDDLLALPLRAAINFHDGPLPRYAGLNAPAWALLHGEREYGISWHEIRGGIDEGDLLKQRLFEIAPDETSISLNTRNFALAIEAFGELVEELGRDAAQKTPQDLRLRSYFGKHQRPDAACLLDFTRPASELAALVRALDFGDYDNPLGLPKLLHAEQLVLVRAAEAVETEQPTEAGTVLALSDEALDIASGEQTLRITKVTRTNGAPLALTAAAAALGLSEGTRLLPPDPALVAQLAAAAPGIAKAETFWRDSLTHLDPTPLALARVDAASALTPHDDPTAAVMRSWPLPAPLVAAAADERAARVLAAFALYLARTSGKSVVELGFSDLRRPERSQPLASFVNSRLPLRMLIDEDRPWSDLVAVATAELDLLAKKGLRPCDDVARFPALRPRRQLSAAASVHGVGEVIGEGIGAGELGQVAVIWRRGDEPTALPPGAVCALVLSDAGEPVLLCDPRALPAEAREALVEQLDTLLTAALATDVADTVAPVAELPLLSAAALSQLNAWNDTKREVPSDLTVIEQLAAQVARTPDQPALTFEGRTLTYRELSTAAERVAAQLQRHGVGPESLVGVHVERSAELLIAALGVWKAGAAYLPLDPDYPQDRLGFMLADSGARVVLTDPQTLSATLDPALTWIDVHAAASGDSLPFQEPAAAGSQLAYVIYTSGSTGKPKGVMVEHRQVVNFFAGMDAAIPHRPGDVWLAVTSLSFDISVLELFWTLTRGLHVLLHRDRTRVTGDATPAANGGEARQVPASMVVPRAGAASGGADFSLFLWGAQGTRESIDGYHLMLEAARFGDQHGFAGIWTPERHFHAFGGAYPNPSITGAAIAAVTQHIQIRAGSCVVPLHQPARVAEEWAVVDQLSRGRVGISFASGWQPDDFVLQPGNYRENKRIMLEQIEQVRRLWRGERVAFPGPLGQDVEVLTQPRPVQPELPFWITTAGNPETFALAGRSGANLLTHLLGQSLDEVAAKIATYRRARREAGHDPRTGIVTLMLHTHLGTSNDAVRERVREPMKAYLRSSVQLIKGFAWAFPAFKRPSGVADDANDIDIGGLSEDELDAVLEFAFERYFETSGLFGTPETCQATVDRIAAIGVDDIACLIDFGMPTEQVLEGLPYLAQLRLATRPRRRDGAASDDDNNTDHGIPALIARHGVTHLQATPALLRMARVSDDAREAIDAVPHLLVGGEAFPANLAQELRARGATPDRRHFTVTNMYGPTETTVWSATHRLQPDETAVPLGRPIANTRLYVLDARRRQLPLGVAGELYIAGRGVVRGYLGRPELTEQRFVPDPFVPGERMYRTGDLARWSSTGQLEFLGRSDHQVKVRGYRIELGEIESQVLRAPGVREAVVVAREDNPGDVRLVAYVTGELDDAQLREQLRSQLPAYMVPSLIVLLPGLPQTPNGKIDRAALPAPEALASARAASYAAPESAIEERVVQLWSEVLGTTKVGIDDNFFDIGGHSLLVVKLHRLLKSQLEQDVALTDLYRFPTVRSFVARTSGAGRTTEQAEERAAMRRDRLSARRELLSRRRAR